MSNNPIISIVMPSYNHAFYIGEAIESILGQTFNDFELIIVDDGSSDESPTIIKHYAMQDSRIIPLFQENQGPSVAVNRGLQIARGQFISSHPSDDKSCSNRFETLLSYLNNHAECDVVGSYIEEINSQGERVSENTRFANWFNVECDWQNPVTWIWQNRMSSPTLLFRRDFFQRFGEFDNHLVYSQDWEIQIRSIAKGANFQIIPSKLFQYRSHENNLTNKNEYEVFREYAYIAAKQLIPWLATKNQTEEVVNCVKGFIYHPVFKSFSKQERENLCLLLVEAFGLSYPDFCRTLSDSADQKILTEQSSIQILSKLFVQYITELTETNTWLESQRKAWENVAAEQNVVIAEQNLAIDERNLVIDELYASPSWRFSRPLRFVARLISEPK